MAAERDFRADIEGLRAIAVLGVLAFHAGVPHVMGGYVGVDVFYVISGFLITSLMLRDRSTGGAGGFLAAFYARRIRRILPAATVVIGVTLVGAALVQNPIENANTAADARGATLFYSNIRFAHHATDYFAAHDAPSPFQQYWSLSLEEQFYLVWPLVFVGLCWFARHRASPRAVLGAGLAIVVAGSLGLSILWMQHEPIRAFYSLPSRAWELGIGALIAVYAEDLARIPSRVRIAMSTLGLGAIAATMIAYTPSTPFPGWSALPPTLGTALVIAASCGAPSGGPLYRVLASKPFQLVGRFSFSLYLWHWPLLVLKVEHVKWLYASWQSRALLMLLVALPAAVVTYYVIENPFRRARFLRASNVRSIAFGIALLALGVLASFAFTKVENRTPLSTSRTVAVTRGALAVPVVPTDFVPANLVPALSDTRDRQYVKCGSPCIVGRSQSPRRFVLFGNSHAGHWGTAMEIVANAFDASLEVHAPGGCASFLIPVALLPTADRPACEARRKRVLASFMAKPPEVVVLSNMTTELFAKHRAEWEHGVREAIRSIPKQTKVVVFAETPRGKQSTPLCLAANLERADRCDHTWAAELNARLQQITVEEGAVFVDLHPVFCTAARCPAITEDMLIYADGDHLTVPYSRARGAWMTETFRAILKR